MALTFFLIINCFGQTRFILIHIQLVKLLGFIITLTSHYVYRIIFYCVKMQQTINPEEAYNAIEKKMEEQMDDDSEFQKLKMYLDTGKREQVRKMAKDTLSAKEFKRLVPYINILEERNKEPLKSSKRLREHNGIDLYLLDTKRNVFDQHLTGDIKTALIVGMTGVGKSTYLNSLVNCIMGVEEDDPFRYLIIDDFASNQSKSVTTQVTSYVIKKQGNMKSNFVLIDVPGMGDTRGIKTDKENLLKIKQTLKNNVPQLNLILYVFKASDTRITAEVEYVMSQVMGMFAKDVAENFLFILTFADVQVPPIVPALKKSFDGVISGLNEDDWYLKVNNSSMFMKIDPSDPIAVNGFKTGMICLQKTVDRILNASIVSTKKTVSVIDKIEKIENYIMALQNQMDIVLNNQDELKQLSAQVANTKADALGKSGFKFKVNTTKLRQKNTENNVTTCLNCKYTCHNNCIYSNGADKINCYAMNSSGYCTCCPEKCNWRFHKNQHYIIEYYTVEEEKTNQDLMRQYKVVIDDKNAKEQLMSQMVIQYMETVTKTNQIIISLKKANQELAEIQLKQVQTKTIIDYLDVLITSEKSQKKDGFNARLRQLEDMKQAEKRKAEALTKDEKQFSKERAKTYIHSIIKDNEVRQSVEKIVKQKVKKQNKTCPIM